MDVLSGPAPKCPGNGDRSARLDAVLAKLPAFRARYGITRVAETTYLDRIDIPTMSAFVPESADVLGVYSGKGRTREEALVTAVMEAVERQICVAYDPPTVSIVARELADELDLRELGFTGPGDRALRCVRGLNLLTGTPLFVPVGLVNPFADPANFSHWTSNGLASGSSSIEALCHALLEVVERHRWSEAEIQARAWPRFLRMKFGRTAERPPAAVNERDDPAAPEIALPTGNPDVDQLARRISAAGVRLRLFVVAESEWPIAMFAGLSQPHTDPPMAHAGTACSWSPERAAIGAITEAVSSRVIAIQGAREDLIRAHEPREGSFLHGRQLAGFPVGRWFFDVPAPSVQFADLADRSSPDLVVDVRRLLDVLRTFGVRCVAMVNLTPPDESVHVVRVVIPGLERFTFDGSVTARTKRLLTRPFDI